MDTFHKYIKDNFRLVFWILLLTAAAAYTLLAFGRNIWSDEAYTFAMLRHSFGEMCAITAKDVHPPLYYIITKLLTMPFNYSLLSVKFVSIIPFLGIIALGGVQFKKLFDERTAVLFMALFILFPFTMLFSVEARMYSMAAFFVFACAVYAYRSFIEGDVKFWCIFTLSAAAAAYTHYFAFVSVGIIYILLLTALIAKKRGRIKFLLISLAALIIMYLPWISAFVSQLIYKVHNEYWIEEITIRKLFDYAYNVFAAGGMKTFALFSFLAYFAAFVYTVRNESRSFVILCLCMLAVPFGTATTGILASWLVRPVFLIRYIAPSAVMIVSFLAVTLGKMNSKTLVSAILTVSLMGGVSNYAYLAKEAFTRHDNGINAEFSKKYDDCSAFIVLAKAENISYMLSHYEPRKEIYRDIPEISPANPFLNQHTLEEFYPQDNKKIALLADKGDRLPEDLSDLYVIQSSGAVFESGHPLDIYILTLK